MKLRAVIALGVLAACGPTSHKNHTDGGAGGGDSGIDAAPLPHVLDGIVVSPTNQIVQLDLNTPGSQVYSAMATYEDGTSDDVSSQVVWAVANPAVGAMTGDTLAIPGFGSADAQTSMITATLAGSGGGSDLSGQAQITVVAYRQSGAQQDFFFILPFEDGSGQMTKPLDFATAIPALDVFFLMDTTASMTGEMQNLQASLNSTVVPGIQAAVTNSEFGVGSLQDFPMNGYGAATSANADCGQGLAQPDEPFRLMQPITSSTSAVQAGVNALSTNGVPIGCGDDWPEGSLESIYQAATGNGLTLAGTNLNVPANHNGVGGVQFRQGTMPVIVTISDADSHGVGENGACTSTAEAYAAPVAGVAHTRQNTKDALNAICARSVGLAAIQTTFPTSCTPTAYMTDLATSTGARVPPTAWDVGTRPGSCASGQCCTGQLGAGVAPDVDGLCPLVFAVKTDGTGVSASLVTGIQMLTRFATFVVNSATSGVMTDINGNPLPTGHTTADFIKGVIPLSATVPPAPPVIAPPTIDSVNNAFDGVTPGTHVTFDVDAFNDFVPQTNVGQIFRATIQVVAGGCTPLDQRDVIILVPPQAISISIKR